MTGYVDRVRSLREGIPADEVWETEEEECQRYSSVVRVERTIPGVTTTHFVADFIEDKARAAFIAGAPAAVTHLLARLDAVEALSGKLSEQPEHRDMAARIRAAITREGA